MATIPDSLASTINAQWTYGDAPDAIYVSDDENTRPADAQDYIWIAAYSLMTYIKPVNDTFSDKTFTIQIEVNTGDTTNKEDRLKEMADEVERIVNTHAITGVDYQKVTRRDIISDKRMPYWRETIQVTLKEFMSDSTTAYGGVSSSTSVTTDELILGGYSVIDILDEDNMVSDRDDALATQQSIKAYVDAHGGGGAGTLAATLVLGNEADGTNLILDSGADLIVYSDDKVTEKARIDGATGDITSGGNITVSRADDYATIEAASSDDYAGVYAFSTSTVANHPLLAVGKSIAADLGWIMAQRNSGTAVLDALQVETSTTGSGADGRIEVKPTGNLAVTFNPAGTTDFASDVDVSGDLIVGTDNKSLALGADGLTDSKIFFDGSDLKICSYGDIYFRNPADNAYRSVFANSFFSYSDFDLTSAEPVLLNLNPTGTGSGQIIDITPTQALLASSLWKAMYLNAAALDPAGAGASVYGIHLKMDGIAMTNNPNVYGIYVELPATYGSATEAAGHFSGDGRTVDVCDDTYAVNVTSGLKIVGDDIYDSGANQILGGNGSGYIDYIAGQGTPSDNDVLAWDTASSKWTVQAQTGGGGGGESLAATLAIGNESDGANIILDSGGDLIVYSDDKVTEKARIDGATGNISSAGVLQLSNSGVAYHTIASTGNECQIEMKGATGYDAGFVFKEGSTNRGAMYYDASLNKFVFYNYTSAETFQMLDAGSAAVTGNFDIGAGCDVTGNITVTGTVDGVDVAALDTTVSGLVSDAAYAAGWDGDTTHAPSKNAVYDKIEAISVGGTLDPDSFRKRPHYSTDFFNGGNSANPPWTGGALSSGTFTVPNMISAAGSGLHHFGVLSVRSSTTANSGYQFTTSRFEHLISGNECFEFTFALITSTNTIGIVGYTDGSTATEPTDGVYFYINGTDFAGKTSSNSSRSTTSSSYTMSTSTWYRGRIVVNSDATSISYTLYNDAGSSLWTDTLTTNIPSGANRNVGSGFVIYNTGTTQSYLIDMDYMAQWKGADMTR